MRGALFGVAIGASALGVVAWLAGRADVAKWAWTAGTIPILAGLGFSILRDFAQGRVGVDAVAFVSTVAAVLLGEALADVIIAVMYSGGNLLEDFAVSRAESGLRSLVARAPRVAHRLLGVHIIDISVEQIASGDRLLVRSGEVIPADGILLASEATIDEAAPTGEPASGFTCQGRTAAQWRHQCRQHFELTATAGESTYAGIITMVTAARTAKAPFIRLADRYALLLLSITLFLAGVAWGVSGDAIRGLAVLVVSTPCPLILAAPVVFIAGVSRAARLGILIRGGTALEVLARTHTVMFDKTGTLTVGGARLVGIEAAPGEKLMPFVPWPPPWNRPHTISSGRQLSWRRAVEASNSKRQLPCTKNQVRVSKAKSEIELSGPALLISFADAPTASHGLCAR